MKAYEVKCVQDSILYCALKQGIFEKESKYWYIQQYEDCFFPVLTNSKLFITFSQSPTKSPL